MKCGGKVERYWRTSSRLESRLAKPPGEAKMRQENRELKLRRP